MLLTRQQLQERLIALHQASLHLIEDIPLDALLERIATVACEQAQAQYAALGIQGQDGKLKQFITVGMNNEEISRMAHPPVGLGLLGALMDSDQAIRIPDIHADARSVGFPENHPTMIPFLGVPIRLRDEQLGQIYLTNKIGQPEFTSDDEQVIQMLAAYAAVAIHNAGQREDLLRLTVLEERERIGMDLHDGIIQSIFGVGLVLEHARLIVHEDPDKSQARIQQAIDSLNQTIRDIRSYILDLRPRQLGNENLLDGLKRLVTEFRLNTLAEATLTGKPGDLAGLPQAHATALFHICQETLANAAKHAGAKKVDVSLWATPERLMMEVRDDGKGFDMAEMNITLGHGLSNIQTRIHQVGGDVEITSVVSEGTSVLAWVPRVARKKTTP
jgi:signal transduction histidine kinase